MCEYCRQYPDHHPRCPEANEPQSIGVCSECGYDIFFGEMYVQFGSILYCDDCVKYNTKEAGEW